MNEDSPTQTSRGQYVKTIGAVGAASSIGLAGCSGNSATATGTLATQVTDQPGDIADFESCVVTIEGIWLKPSEEGESEATTVTDGDGIDEQDEEDVDESDAREHHEFDEAQEADLVELQNGNTDLVDERDVAAQDYEFLQLDVSDVEGVLTDGGEAEVDTPGSAPLQFKHRFEVREDQRTTFTGDFTPVERGQTNRYLLQPVASGTEVSYEDIETTTATTTATTATTTSEP